MTDGATAELERRPSTMYRLPQWQQVPLLQIGWLPS